MATTPRTLQKFDSIEDNPIGLDRQALGLEGPGEEASELEPREEDRRDEEQCGGRTDQQRAIIRQSQLPHSTGPARNDLEMH